MWVYYMDKKATENFAAIVSMSWIIMVMKCTICKLINY